MLDSSDAALLRLLQQDAKLTAQELAERVGLSPSQCARRRQRLEEEGYIRRYRAVLDWDRLGLGVSAFIQVVMTAHTRENAEDFVRLIRRSDEIVGAWTLTGEFDYLLRVAVRDLADLNRVVQEVLLPHPAVARVQSRIVMERIKADAPTPVRAG
jgi:DNA-binding Lrp family transcriptional regulator